MTVSSLPTHDARRDSALALVNAVANGAHYVFVADPRPLSGSVSDPVDSEADSSVESYRDMIAGKLVTSSDAALLIPNVPWVTGTVYDRYDDQLDMADLDAHAVVNAGAYYHVWKCLDNYDGAASTEQPVLADVDASDELYETGDGYRWKYTYSVASAVASKFSTTDWFPIGANATVVAAAVDGAVDTIFVSNSGLGYHNYLTGSFSSSDSAVGNSTTFRVSGNDTSNSTTGFYTGCLMYISSGTGVGQYRSIVHSFANSGGRYVVVANSFVTAPVNASEYEIYPQVTVSGTGQTSDAVARALINATAGNAVLRVEMLARGAGYEWHQANVVANAAVGVSSNAVVRSVYSPPGGHGSDPGRELGARACGVSVTLANTESNTIPANGTFRRVGLLRDPLFRGVSCSLTNATGTFVANETVVSVTRRVMANGAVATESNTALSLASANSLFRAGDWVYARSSDDLHHQVVSVVSANSTYLIVTPAMYWSCTVTACDLANVSTAGVVTAVPDGSTLVVGRAPTNSVSNGVLLVGLDTGARGTVNAVSRQGVTKGFATFQALTRVATGAFTGTFTAGEVVSDAAGDTALVYSSNATAQQLLVSNVIGSFTAGSVLTGANSAAHATVSNSYASEVEFRSGTVLVVENATPVTRSNATSEDLQLILTF